MKRPWLCLNHRAGKVAGFSASMPRTVQPALCPEGNAARIGLESRSPSRGSISKARSQRPSHPNRRIGTRPMTAAGRRHSSHRHQRQTRLRQPLERGAGAVLPGVPRALFPAIHAEIAGPKGYSFSTGRVPTGRSPMTVPSQLVKPRQTKDGAPRCAEPGHPRSPITACSSIAIVHRSTHPSGSGHEGLT